MSPEPFLTYGNLRLLNVPHGKPVYDEVLVEDCYGLESIPHNGIVIDIGGYYGEFGIWCAKNRGSVRGYFRAFTGLAHRSVERI